MIEPKSLATIAFQTKILEYLSEIKGEPNRFAVAANTFRCVELCGTRKVYRNIGPVSPIVNIVCFKLKETNVSGRGISRWRYAAEQVGRKVVVAQEA